MRRRLISLLAMLGVLLHAGMIVRHNAMMIGADLDQAAFADIFSEICHSGKIGGQNASATPDAAPHPPDQNNPESHCPDCLGFVGPAALLPAIFVKYDATYSIASDAPNSSDVVRPEILGLWPPGQGPPSRV